MNLELSASNPTWPILLGAAAVVALLLYGKRAPDTPPSSGLASSVGGLFGGSRLSVLMSLVSLLSQAGNLREFARRLLAMGIEWANKQPPPAVTPPTESPTEK